MINVRKGIRPVTPYGRVLMVLVAVAALLAGVTLTTASPAQAKVPGFVYGMRMRNLTTNRCIDDSVLGLRPLGCNNTDFQNFRLNYFLSNGTYELQNYATGNCMDDSPQYHLRMAPCNGGWGGYQQWRQRTDPADGWSSEWLNVATGLCLDDSVAFGLRTTGRNGGLGNYQYFSQLL